MKKTFRDRGSGFVVKICVMKKKGTVFFIPHGGGPLPILEDPGHVKMIKFLKKYKI